MTRHARNCTAGAVYTYHEKKKDAAASGYGTQSERVGKDSVKNFDCCSLTLQPCRNPVVTKEGYLFDKEAILEYIVSKKTEYTRKLKNYEKQLKKEDAEKAELAAAEKEANLIKFMNREKNISSNSTSKSSASPSTSNSVSNLANGKDKELPSFWVPSQLPDAKVSKLEKPDSTVYCPISGKPLKMKDLIEVKWTLVNDPDDKKSLIAKENRYMCPVTHDILSNAVPCAVIRTTGHVVTMECVEKIIKKDWLHPLTGDKLKEKDIIPMQRGGTGYALTNQNLEGKNERPVLQA
ncbi:nitric oxide synthase-interacting protein homolog [Galleria mellonella]|uniref:Nitric oxide synthase-interacting protein homolog n=1 Tax=Galleria mellonella TaxID=7137 RepID=A0A6J1X6D1_GALME|nr:nitric oxide synthase-interacting protein homolog [Galleria mellonella]XP_031763491.1 nitric oxide synthase-interacting protein homolog [Galleria mellonella]